MAIVTNKKRAQVCYTLINAVYWSIYGITFGFATVYFRACGFTNSAIGLILGGIYLTSALIQPILASFIERRGFGVATGIARVYIVAIIAGIVSLPLGNFPVARCVTAAVMLVLQSALQPEMVALAKQFEMAGYKVDYGCARGFGSLAYAVMAAVFGYVYELTSPILLPAFSVAVMIAMVALIKKIAVPNAPVAALSRSLSRGERGRTNSARFRLFLLGAACLTIGMSIQEKYMLQIVSGMGAGVAMVGVITAVEAGAEFPAMLLFSRLNKKFSTKTLLVVAGWAWFFKNGLVLFAATPTQICLIQLLQFCSFALFIPSAVQFVSEFLPANENTLGQSLTGSAYSAGGFIAIFAGGFLLDLTGVKGTLEIAQLFTLVGSVSLTLGVLMKDKPGA